MERSTMVSFIIPVYNGEKYIERCIRSIIDNTKGNYEIIIINDGSTDNTLGKIEKLRTEFYFIKIFSQKNLGVSLAREYGIKEANGRWIVFVDADDYITSDIVGRIGRIKSEEYDWIIFSGQFQKESTYRMDLPNDRKNVITTILNQSQRSAIQNGKLNAVWSKAYKKRIIEESGIHFEGNISHGEDMLFNLDYAKNCRTVYCMPESVYRLCSNESSATHKFQQNSVENDREFFHQLNTRVHFDSDNDLLNSYYRMVLNGIWICLGQYFSHHDNRDKISVRCKKLAVFLKHEPYKTALRNYNVEKNKGKRYIFAMLNLHFYGLVLVVFKIRRQPRRDNRQSVKEI